VFAFQRYRHDRRSAASGSGLDDLVDELDQVVWESDCYLSAHPVMVAVWEQWGVGGGLVAGWALLVGSRRDPPPTGRKGAGSGAVAVQGSAGRSAAGSRRNLARRLRS
jgi:hypothetical protein